MHSRRHILIGLAALCLAPPPAGAAQVRYRLIKSDTRAGFTFTLNGVPQRGELPVVRADIRLDPARLQDTSAEAVLDARRARTGLAFATEALRGPAVLDAARFPEVRFRSTRVQLGPQGRLSGGARITGRLTLRGVTRQVTLAAGFYRQAGSAPDDLRVLDVRLNGQINRYDFGARGYPDLVAPQVGLDIRARIAAA
ncbi:YceI family protein [Roseobacteraceae bacterium NS-SX3]